MLQLYRRYYIGEFYLQQNDRGEGGGIPGQASARKLPDGIESIACVSVLFRRWMKFKYDLGVSVIQIGWVTLSPFHVLVFYKLDG